MCSDSILIKAAIINPLDICYLRIPLFPLLDLSDPFSTPQSAEEREDKEDGVYKKNPLFSYEKCYYFCILMMWLAFNVLVYWESFKKKALHFHLETNSYL